MNRVLLLSIVVALLGCSGEEISVLDLQAELFAESGWEEVEDLRGACMRRNGFEYRSEAPTASAATRADGSIPTDREFAAEYGYGLSTIVFGEAMSPTRTVSSNDEILDGLSGVERDAWNYAMYDAPDRCIDVEPIEQRQRDAVAAALDSEVEEMTAQIENDPRRGQAESAWRRCALSNGLDYLDPSAPRSELLAELNALLLTEELDERSLTQIQSREIEIAVALFECDETYTSAVRSITHEHQERFVLNHESEIRSEMSAID